MDSGGATNQPLQWTTLSTNHFQCLQTDYSYVILNCLESIHYFFSHTEKQEESGESSFKTPSRPSSTVALSLSETSTRRTSSKNHSTPQTVPLPINPRKKSSHTRFSCYTKPHHVKTRSKTLKKPPPMDLLPKNNNHHRQKISRVSSRKPLIKLTHECREQMCQKCSRLLQTSSRHISSKLLCQSCSHLIQHSNQILPKTRLPLNKTEENELRQIIEIVIEEFQDQFGHALNLSIKQMTQHLLSNINLFYQHYQQEFEQLTKKYRLAFLERFLHLMNKIHHAQTNQHKPSISTRVRHCFLLELID